MPAGLELWWSIAKQSVEYALCREVGAFASKYHAISLKVRSILDSCGIDGSESEYEPTDGKSMQNSHQVNTDADMTGRP
jgi:hypothetical protein